MENQNLTIGLLLVGGTILAGLFYFIPTMVAYRQGHRNAFAVFLLNLLLGWTFIGWVVALVWAFTRDRDAVR